VLQHGAGRFVEKPMSTKANADRKGIARSASPRTAVRDAVLTDASANIDDHETIAGLLWATEAATATATITGPGRMVAFDDYRKVQL